MISWRAFCEAALFISKTLFKFCSMAEMNPMEYNVALLN